MSITNAIASVAVSDLSSSVRWYQELFGRTADSTPMPELAEWKFAGGGWLQVYQLAERAGACSCTLAVDALDETLVRLQKMGVNTDQQSSNSQVKTVMVQDPDGNHIAFAQTLDASMAR